jgi:hypothetical protein
MNAPEKIIPLGDADPEFRASNVGACRHCGESFRKHQSGTRFCSRRCSSLFREEERRRDAEQRFWRNIDRRGLDECWPWLAGTTSGYGQIRFRKEKLGAHVLSYRLAHGTVPLGKMVLHRCGNRICCNPNHLYAGTYAQNTNDAVGHGTHKCGFGLGDQHKSARLRAVDIPAIRKALTKGESQRSVAAKFGVAQQTISHVAHGRTWKHVA